MTRLPVVVVASSVLLLSGCFGPLDVSVDDGAPTTVSAAELASTAEDVVLGQGFTVEIDCGSDAVPLAVGTSLECSGLDAATGATGTYTLTITSVDGADYVLSVVGSEVPAGDAVFEPATVFAQLTAQAVTDFFGEEPIVDCGTDDIEIFVGQEVRCAYSTSTASGFVISTITSLEGTVYEFSVTEE